MLYLFTLDFHDAIVVTAMEFPELFKFLLGCDVDVNLRFAKS